MCVAGESFLVGGGDGTVYRYDRTCGNWTPLSVGEDGAIVGTSVLFTLASSLMYFVEHDVQPEAFANILVKQDSLFSQIIYGI